MRPFHMFPFEPSKRVRCSLYSPLGFPMKSCYNHIMHLLLSLLCSYYYLFSLQLFCFQRSFVCFLAVRNTHGCVCDCVCSPLSLDSESGSQMPCDQLVSPMALAACTRVDSCFAPWFVPSLGVSLQLAQLDVHLCHHLEQLGTGKKEHTQSQSLS